MITARIADRFWSKVDKLGKQTPFVDTRCWDWTGSISGPGYGNMFVDIKTGSGYAHRISWEIANGPIPFGLQIAHLCGSRPCVNPDHLIACSQSENEAHKHAHGRANKATGEGHHSAKLTDIAVVLVLADHTSGLSQRSIAKKYGVSRGSIREIIRGRTWRHIPRTADPFNDTNGHRVTANTFGQSQTSFP